MHQNTKFAIFPPLTPHNQPLMDQILQDYTKYYKVRMDRYANNPMFPFSYQSEKALYEAMANAQTGHDFKNALEAGNLNVKNGIALVKDKETARLAHWTELKEPIRALAPQRILADIDSAQTDMDVANKVSDIETQVGVEISIDGFADNFYGLDLNFKVLEDIEVSLTAEVPDEWKSDQQASAQRDTQLMVDGFNRDREDAAKWKPGWRLDYNILWEDRHRRKIPVPDEQLQKRIDQVKQMMGE